MKKFTGLYFASGKSAYTKLSTFISRHSKWLLLSDEGSRRHCKTVFRSKLSVSPSLEYSLEAGEKSKSLKNAEKIISLMMENGFDRNSLIVNLGGGMVTDMGGFLGAIYMRGIDYCNVPTTLLCMADAATGGKTGVNVGGLKNQAGCFHQPSLVLMDVNYLHSLPDSELRSGFAEIVKHALIDGDRFWKRISKLETLEAGQISESLIRDSIRVKDEIVKSDPFESGRRRILNLGHTFGHALETFFLNNKKAFTHGHAVAEGILLENSLSVILGLLPEKDMADIHRFFRRFYKPLHLDEKAWTCVIDLMEFDKKNYGGKLKFTLLKEIGKAVTGIEANDNKVRQAIGLYRTFG